MVAFYDGLMFFIILFIGMIPAIVLQIQGNRISNYILVFTIFIIYLALRSEPIQMVYLFVYLLFEWHLLAGFQWYIQKYGRNPHIFHHFILFAILPLLLAKCSPFWGHNWFAFIGISYITFRVLQILIESYDGIIKKSNFLETMNFLLFFPTFSSGPIDRSRRFELDLNKIKSRETYFDMIQRGLRKLLHGALYKFVLSSIAFS